MHPNICLCTHLFTNVVDYIGDTTALLSFLGLLDKHPSKLVSSLPQVKAGQSLISFSKFLIKKPEI